MSISILTPEHSSPASLLRGVELTGPVGRLEAILNEGSPDAPLAALLCHPHPLGGGNLHNKVVYHAMKVCNDTSWGFRFPALRFNFRGTGASAGHHDGLAESADVLAAVDWLWQRFQRPILLAGFSFGAAMALKAAAEALDYNKIKAMALLGLPVGDQFPRFNTPTWLRSPLPKLLLSGDGDAFAPVQHLQQAALAATPGRLVILPGADHFFTGQLGPMQQALAQWLRELLS